MENPSTHSPGGSAALTPEEIEALPERVRQYIADLHKKISELQHASYRTEDRLRKANWGNWSRKGR
jgi:hypothetical protein